MTLPRAVPACFDYLYDRDSIEAVLRTYLPADLQDDLVQRVSSTGFCCRPVLERMRRRIAAFCEPSASLAAAAASEPRTIVDLGCGSGGLGLWLASVFGFELRGIDGSALAIDRARALASQAQPRSASFECADFGATRLPSGAAAIVISHDSLYLAPQRQAAIAEAGRLLRRPGLLLFSVYAQDSATLAAWRMALTRAHLRLVEMEDCTAEWRRVMRAKHELRLRHEPEVLRALGRAGHPELDVSRAMLGIGQSSFLETTRRFEFVVLGEP
jgi:SAM-dependent methyltransferase